MNTMNSPSDIEVNYLKLQALLASQQWKAADFETLNVMLQVSRFPDNPDMVGDVSQFPYEVLQTIDRLWLKHSDGHFGFSAQITIWKSLGGTFAANELVDLNFFDNVFAPRVGWKKNTKFLNWEELDYSLNAPKGQLPATWVNSDTIVAANGQIYAAWKRLQNC
jgi:eukaryotic-like serine/threonine-protein kinase